MKTLVSHSQSPPCLRKLGSGPTRLLSIHPSDIMIFLFYDFSFNPLFFLHSFKGGTSRNRLLKGGVMFHKKRKTNRDYMLKWKFFSRKGLYGGAKKKEAWYSTVHLGNYNFSFIPLFQNIRKLERENRR